MVMILLIIVILVLFFVSAELQVASAALIVFGVGPKLHHYTITSG